MDFLPIFIAVRNRDCMVVGGGEVAARKVALLLRAGARVTIIAPRLCEELNSRLSEQRREQPGKQLAQARITHRAEVFRSDHLVGAVLVIAATDDAAVNREVSEVAKGLRIPVNVVDDPAWCSFIMPSIVDRTPILVAVSSGGASPVLARLLRARLEAMIPVGYGRLAAYAARFREQVKQRFAAPQMRRRFWEKALQGPFAEMVFAGRDQAAEAYLKRLLDNGTDEASGGEVYLVGAGPGDPELLTLRAMRLMQQADVVVFDRLVSPEILDMVRRDATRIY